MPNSKEKNILKYFIAESVLKEQDITTKIKGCGKQKHGTDLFCASVEKASRHVGNVVGGRQFPITYKLVYLEKPKVTNAVQTEPILNGAQNCRDQPTTENL